MRTHHRSVLPFIQPQPGDGGIGQSWFVVELTSEHVPIDVEPPPDHPPYVPIPGPAPRRRRGRRIRYGDRFPGQFRVVKSIEQRFPARVLVNETRRFAGTFTVIETGSVDFSALLSVSTLRFRRLQEEELVLLMMDE